MNDDLKPKSSAGAPKKSFEKKKHVVHLSIEGAIINQNGGLEQLKQNIYYFLGQK